ncbi:MAG: peptidylprolyl isomerase, partial [Chloroflexota bacterium]|nr:peptidylprolyl isomerase [Chloroflexota bacterium]
ANSGANTNGSQFFIMHGSAALPKAYVIFGQVIKGQDVVDKIATVQLGPGNPGELSRPVQDVLLKKVTIAETGP